MAGNFCAERVSIYKLTCESSCCELTTSGSFHTCLTYPDYKAIKLHRVMLELVLLRTVIQRCLSWLFPCIHQCVPCPLGSHPPQSKAVVVLTWLNVFHTWTWGLRLFWGSPGSSLASLARYYLGFSTSISPSPPAPPLSLCAPLRLYIVQLLSRNLTDKPYKDV